MNVTEIIEKFVCPGCINGSDTQCGNYKPSDHYGHMCDVHVLGTRMTGIGHLALGLPKGFNRSGWEPYTEKSNNTMYIRCWPKNSKFTQMWDKFNVAVWALEQDGCLFVRTYSPRVNQTYVDIIDGGNLDLVPVAIDVSKFHSVID